ncbi:acyl-CoA thioesterase [Sulfitobacter sabulilitoris]|uniref:Acyl-CoA thioesterase n=1 Tax=Sulfitobacter sabulilitoris TaxID=2562655 RepID=A0A5S3P7P9_9RHOB|nr:thioesterase family protein [Sulfitobacter sabulilitoris]TMM49307.1 acyl-CoA thioesterase [Sulfitobacter sabulilitoris]
MADIFELPIKVLFQHCDPAGIVFYPRYFEMVNQTVEEWHELGLDYSFARMHSEDRRGVPTVSIGAEFSAPSRLGDVLTWRLELIRLGRTSAHLRVTALAGDELRMVATPVLVCLDMDSGRPVPWADGVRAAMSKYLAAQ